MPFKNASAFSRTYSSQFGKPHYLAYVVPDANKLLELVNDKLSPFAEPFSKSDLDIMYVNSDGSVGSTSGYVEDKPAAQAPDLSKFETQDSPAENEYEVDENGNIIDPETGEIIEVTPGVDEIDPENPGTEQDPEEPGMEVDPGNPGTTEPEITEPETEVPSDQPGGVEEEPGVTDLPIDFGPPPGEEGNYMPPEEIDTPAEPEIVE